MTTIPILVTPAQTGSGWTEPRISALKSLWSDGLSASEVARTLGGGLTRNAVLGKLYRLGLCKRRGVTPSPRSAGVTVRRPRLRPAPAPRPVVKDKAFGGPLKAQRPETAAAEDEPGLVRDLVALGSRACKWPIGDPRSVTFSFCGRDAKGVYCDHHETVAHRPRPASVPEKDVKSAPSIPGSVLRQAA